MWGPSENLQCKTGQNGSGQRHPLTLSKSKILLDPFKLIPRLMLGGLYFWFSWNSVFLKHPNAYTYTTVCPAWSNYLNCKDKWQQKIQCKYPQTVEKPQWESIWPLESVFFAILFDLNILALLLTVFKWKRTEISNIVLQFYSEHSNLSCNDLVNS